MQRDQYDVDIYDLVAKNVRYFRVNNRKFALLGVFITQEKLAELVDMSSSMIRNVEAGNVHQYFSLALVYRISRALDVEISEFFVERDFASGEKNIKFPKKIKEPKKQREEV